MFRVLPDAAPGRGSVRSTLVHVIIEFAEAQPWAGSLRFDGGDEVRIPFEGRLDLLRLLEPLTDPDARPNTARHPGPELREQR